MPWAPHTHRGIYVHVTTSYPPQGLALVINCHARVIGRYSTVCHKRGAHMACDWTLCNNRSLTAPQLNNDTKCLKVMLERFGALRS